MKTVNIDVKSGSLAVFSNDEVTIGISPDRVTRSSIEVHTDAMFNFEGCELYFTNIYLDLLTPETHNPDGCSTVEFNVPGIGSFVITVLDQKLYDFTLLETGYQMALINNVESN